MKKFAFLAAITGLIILFFPSNAIAQSNADLFRTSLHTTVTVYDSGLSTVTHQFSITNKTPTTFVSQYGMKLSSSKLQNITVTSNGEELKPEVVVSPPGQKTGPGQTSIGITFPDKIVGEGKTREFTISYQHPDVAVISGRVLEVTLPAQANPQDYDEYVVTLITPAQFGPPIRTTPTNFSYTPSTKGNQIITTFPGGAHGVFALFGNTQLFDLNLKYILKNDTNNVGITQIALPPDTAYQQLYYHSLDPIPQKMEPDQDGNWIATYQLPAGSQTTVNLVATAKLSLEPNPVVPVSPPTSELLDAQEFWPVHDDAIAKLAKQYATPEAIDHYVVDTLSYNTQQALDDPQRLGASEALKQPTKAVCTEFTDVFVTMARAAKIPARRIAGYAYTQNNTLRPLSLVNDVLHAWPEYYDTSQHRWIPIDPTWEDTTGGVDYFHQVDLNHIVFAINGHNSSTPYPAGSYRDEQTNEKTVSVTFGSAFPDIPFSVEQQLTPKKLMGVAIPGLYELHVRNTTGHAWYNTPITVTASRTQLLNTKQADTIPTLLPFQTITMPIHVEAKSGLLPVSDTIQVTIDHDSQTYTITSGPALSHYVQRPVVLVGVATICIVLTLGTGSVLVLRRRRQRPVRR